MKEAALTFLLLVVVATAGVAEGGEAPVVQTEEGRISGVVEESVKGRTFYSYYGLPYAKPPLGAMRLKNPEPHRKWSGVLDGSSMKEPCLQISFVPFILNKEAEDQDYEGNEDCLYLNVFRPKVDNDDDGDDDDGLPVMVWIHGGGFFTGGAHEYYPHPLMDKDVVVVTLQYRLGIFGFLSTEDKVMPGNFGLKDQTLALKWVQRNIHHFGGDKSRVTLFGESAGGASIHYQMVAPEARGLFIRAIPQSGTVLGPYAFVHSPGLIAKRVASGLDCPTDQGSDQLLSCLQGLDSHTVVHQMRDLFSWFILPLPLGPHIDGEYLPASPAQLVREGKVAKVDMMSGVTKDEGSFFSLGAYCTQSILDALNNDFPMAGPASLQFTPQDTQDPVGLATQVYTRYLGDNIHISRDNAEEFTEMLSDRHFKLTQDLAALYHAEDTTTKTYSYELLHRAQLSIADLYPTDFGKHWVVHADDLFYLFRGGPLLDPDNMSASRPHDLVDPQDLTLREIMLTLWTNFATTGNPTPDSSLGFKWDPVSPGHLIHLALTPTPFMMPDQRKEAREYHLSLPTKLAQDLDPHGDTSSKSEL